MCQERTKTPPPPKKKPPIQISLETDHMMEMLSRCAMVGITSVVEVIFNHILSHNIMGITGTIPIW